MKEESEAGEEKEGKEMQEVERGAEGEAGGRSRIREGEWSAKEIERGRSRQQ